MQRKFTKMHGCGNDFIVIDDRENQWGGLVKEKAALLCHRRFGIGADQILVLRHSDQADYRMDIYNADGSQVEMCGNGIRCLLKYIRDRQIDARSELAIETLGGIMRPKFVGELVRVDMGEPILEGRQIPVDAAGRIVEKPLQIDDEIFLVTCVSMGNPHCVIHVSNLKQISVPRLGSMLEKHPFFPNRVNVEFVEVKDRDYQKMKVWERGAGETLACGTGACASVVAGVLTGRTDREVTVSLAGGDLLIEWSQADNRVYMTGPATHVFNGEIEV